jgi:hypothetical protein
MTSTNYQNVPRRGEVDEPVAPRSAGPAPKPRSPKGAARRPRADLNTVVTLVLPLVAASAEAEGSNYFHDLAEPNAELQHAALHGVLEKGQLLGPFGFTVYAQLAGAQLSPVELR